MPFGYEETQFWLSSLSDRPDDPYDEARGRLRNAYYSFRKRAAILAAEIPQDLREYTVHDATHLDALWELADLIGGPECQLTPTEAFVLGGAFLIHDLGMGLAAWPGGISELMQDRKWRDIVASIISELYGHHASSSEIETPPAEALEIAKQTALRERHADRASELALISWSTPGSSDEYHLIEDEDLRITYGHLIGRIAASHWWTVDYVALQFPNNALGAPVDCPSEWTVDPLKLACLLRLADAAHIDARRAPGFLRAIRRPSGISRAHWIFQGHIQRPLLEGDRLVYTSPQPFSLLEAEAWWLCYDTLQMVDRELHAVDSLLADKSRPQMAARSVKGADSPFRLSILVPTEGWSPVDARVVVSNVPALARKLGGENLYGPRPSIALRELIQNASDATRALRALTSNHPPPIRVTLEYDGDDWILEVADSGIGMSQELLTGPLLDFGKSYWGTQLMRQESPGLAASSFEPAGRFGIGFYSVFMLGDEVSVISRRYDGASIDTKVLEFPAGLNRRPILRPAKSDEMLFTGGTRVRVRLRDDPYEFDGLLGNSSIQGAKTNLRRLCGSVAPGLSADLVTVQENHEEQVCICAEDWKTMPAEELLMRVSTPLPYPDATAFPLADAAAALSTIVRNGEIIARASLAPPHYELASQDGFTMSANGKIIDGGLEVGTIQRVIGLFVGFPNKADRSVGSIRASGDELSQWATSQARIWGPVVNRHHTGWEESLELLVLLRADITGIHVCCTRDAFLDTDGVANWASTRTEIDILTATGIHLTEIGDGLEFWDRLSHTKVDIGDDTLIIFESNIYVEPEIWDIELSHPDWAPDFDKEEGDFVRSAKGWWFWNQLTIPGLVIEKIGEAWGCDLEATLDLLTEYERSRVTRDADPSGSVELRRIAHLGQSHLSGE